MTFTQANGLTSCDTCHALVGPTWREKSEHDGTHVRGAQLAARQARIDAATRAQTRCTSTCLALGFVTIGTSEAAPDMSPEPPLHPDLAEYKMKSSARQAVPPLTFRGVA